MKRFQIDLNIVNKIASKIGVASIMLLMLLWYSPCVSADAHLTLVTDEIDMGEMTADESREQTVKFINDGDEPLEIERVTTDCGCTVADYPLHEILPGEEGEIKISFSGRGREPGSFKKIVRVRSNASEGRKLIFVKGKIILPIRK